MMLPPHRQARRRHLLVMALFPSPPSICIGATFASIAMNKKKRNTERPIFPAAKNKGERWLDRISINPAAIVHRALSSVAHPPL